MFLPDGWRFQKGMMEIRQKNKIILSKKNLFLIVIVEYLSSIYPNGMIEIARHVAKKMYGIIVILLYSCEAV
mgnify:CR=1 FL=1